MTTPLKLKRSSVASKVPLTTDLLSGELSLNTYDGTLFFKKTVNSTDSIVTIREISAGSGITMSNGAVSVDTTAIQAKLVSGTNIKTVNGTSLLGSGDVTISSGGGLTSTAIKTSAYTAVANDLVRCNTTSGAFSITLPSAPTDGTIVGILDVASTFATNAITLLPNGKTIEGDSAGFMLDVSGSYETFIYNSATSDWRLMETPSGSSSAFWNGFTGSGNVVLATSPTLVTPILGAASATSLSLTNALTVANGGTGSTSLTANSVLLGNGTGAVQTVAPGTSGYVLTSNGTTWSSQPAPISLPSQTGNATKYLTTDGSTASWANLPQKVSVLNRSGTTINVSLTTGYLGILNRSSTTIQVSIT